MGEMYILFDLDDTLVHSDAVRRAFATVAFELGVDAALMSRTLDDLPGCPAHEIFAALGGDGDAPRTAAGRFLAVLDEINDDVPTVPYPDADTTLRELAARGSTLMLSTGSSPERAHRVLEQEGWSCDFELVLGSDTGCAKGRAHYDRIATQASDPAWTDRAVTVGDSPNDMRLAVEHGVPVRIGVDRDGDPAPLLAAGATHVVSELSEILPILAVAA